MSLITLQSYFGADKTCSFSLDFSYARPSRGSVQKDTGCFSASNTGPKGVWETQVGNRVKIKWKKLAGKHVKYMF